jgi:RimJ/RimL family protein N-acetyltransferase
MRLEPLGHDHAEALWAASRDERTWTWLPIARPATRAALATWLDQAFAAAAAGAELPLVTISRSPLPGSSLPALADGGVLVGSTRYLALRPEHRSVEIGWTWLHPDAWGSGVNVEAKLLMLRHAFEVWACRRVELKTDALNERSRAAIEALGASFEGIHRHHMLVRGGENRDTAWYALLEEDWPAAQRLLHRRLERSRHEL